MTNTPVRVGMLIHNYLPIVGGAERQLAGLIPRLATHGVTARVIARHRPGLPRHEVMGQVDVTRVRVDRVPKAGSVLYSINALRDVARRPVDVLHAHSLLSPATTAAAGKRLFGVPAIAKVLRGGSLGDLADLRRKGVGDLRFRMLRSSLDGFVAISREIDRELANYGVAPSQRWFVPNGVDTERFAPVDPDTRCQHRTALNLTGDPLIVFVGRLAPEKGLDVLMRSWDLVRSSHPRAGLVLVGDGSTAGTLRSFTGAGVHMVGEVDDVAPYLAAADAFVLPSRAEGLSNAMLEAMAAGLPPIATSVGGAVDLISPEVGWQVDVDDSSGLAEALDDALSDPSRLVVMGRCARAAIESRYSLDGASARLAALYRTLIERN